MNSFILKGNVCYSESVNKLNIFENSYLVCVDDVSKGVFSEIPEEYINLPVKDYGNCIIIPGLIDLHAHASQYAYVGTGMDCELLDWLNAYAFSEEGKFADTDYANTAYEIFVNDLKKSATTRACLFATIHTDATLILMEKLEKSGLICSVGKVNMNRNSAEYLTETTESSLNETMRWLNECRVFSNTKPIITPRFIPSCSDELMQGLGDIIKNENVPVQSHLSENLKEIQWVQELEPWSKYYGDVYDRFNMMGSHSKSVMAHCIYSCNEELKLMKDNGVFAVHCPNSNTNVVAGIAPMRKYIDKGLKLGLGSDVSGGNSLSIFEAMKKAIQVSKLYWRLIDQSQKPLTVDEVFYMATKGGGEFFGKVGSFENGFEFDCVIIDDIKIPTAKKMNLHDRLERIIYRSSDDCIIGKFVNGKQII